MSCVNEDILLEEGDLRSSFQALRNNKQHGQRSFEHVATALPWFGEFNVLVQSEIFNKFDNLVAMSHNNQSTIISQMLTEFDSLEEGHVTSLFEYWHSHNEGTTMDITPFTSTSGESHLDGIEDMVDGEEPQMVEARVLTVGKYDYELGTILGKGGFGVVRIGYKNGYRHKPFALKFISKRHLKHEKQYIRAEIEIMRKVKHPNLLRFYRHANIEYPKANGDLQPSVLLVTEFCPNGELFDIIVYSDGLITERIARTYFRQLINGVIALHKAKVCHRDIKPANLLLNKDFNLKICDFGLSKMWKDMKLMTTRVGTRPFMAPEMLMKFKYTEGVDIFSCGVVLFNLITGNSPFRMADPSKDKDYRRLASKRYEPFWKKIKKKVSGECKDIINKMLMYQPGERIKIKQILKHSWYQGEVYKGADLVSAMTEIHDQCFINKQNDPNGQFQLNSDLMNAAERDPTKYPLAIITEKGWPHFVKTFHTYVVKKGKEKDIYTAADVVASMKNHSVRKDKKNWCMHFRKRWFVDTYAPGKYTLLKDQQTFAHPPEMQRKAETQLVRNTTVTISKIKEQQFKVSEERTVEFTFGQISGGNEWIILKNPSERQIVTSESITRSDPTIILVGIKLFRLTENGPTLITFFRTSERPNESKKFVALLQQTLSRFLDGPFTYERFDLTKPGYFDEEDSEDEDYDPDDAEFKICASNPQLGEN